jgi:hypothetical protein
MIQKTNECLEDGSGLDECNKGPGVFSHSRVAKKPVDFMKSGARQVSLLDALVYYDEDWSSVKAERP